MLHTNTDGELQIDLGQFLAEDGSVHYGRLMRFYRKEVMQWKNAQVLADVYNDVMRYEDAINVRWIQRVEKDNKVPADLQRRWILATLLNIPPSYFGLKTLKPLHAQYEEEITVRLSTNTALVDMHAYDARLHTLWTSWATYYDQSPTKLLEEIATRIYTLEHVVFYGKAQQRSQAAPMLCNYLILSGNIYRDQGHLKSALTCLDQAITLAKDSGYYELCAKARYLRGYVFFDRWSLRENSTDYRDLQLAILDFQAAHMYARQERYNGIVSQPLQAAIVAEWGLAQAYCVHDEKDRYNALTMIDEAEQIVNSYNFQRDWRFLHVNEEWHIIDKAEAYNAINWPKSALYELSRIQKGEGQQRLRYIYTDIIEAEANIASGRMEMGVACAESALNMIADNYSQPFLARIISLYEALKQNNKYNKSPEVARLGAKILRVQYAELFQ